MPTAGAESLGDLGGEHFGRGSHPAELQLVPAEHLLTLRSALFFPHNASRLRGGGAMRAA